MLPIGRALWSAINNDIKYFAVYHSNELSLSKEGLENASLKCPFERGRLIVLNKSHPRSELMKLPFFVGFKVPLWSSKTSGWRRSASVKVSRVWSWNHLVKQKIRLVVFYCERIRVNIWCRFVLVFYSAILKSLVIKITLILCLYRFET